MAFIYETTKGARKKGWIEKFAFGLHIERMLLSDLFGIGIL